MRYILILTTFLLHSIFSFSQNADKKPVTDSASVQANNFGVVSKKATQGKYAILYIYRPKSRKKSFASFTINVNDSAVCKIKSNARFTIKLYRFGNTEVWAKSESRSSLTMNLEMGKEYYLKCKVKKGFWAESPDLALMDPKQGKAEFDEAEEDY